MKIKPNWSLQIEIFNLVKGFAGHVSRETFFIIPSFPLYLEKSDGEKIGYSI